MPIAEVRQLRTSATAQQESAVERLEHALAMVREGSVVAVAIALVKLDGAAGGMYSQAENGINLLGSIELLKHRIADDLNTASVATGGDSA